MSQEVNRKLICILSTDVVGYSRLMEDNEASTVRYLEENKKLISKLIEEHNGRVIDSPGDNLLAEFSSAVKAVDCAVKIQKELKIKNSELVENRRMQFRIGINLGDVIEEDGRLYGSGVNIAARLENLAQPDDIFISRNVYDQVKTKLDLGYEYLGEYEVKNISEPVRVYRVQTGIVTSVKVVGEKKDSGKTFSREAFSAVIILIIIAAGITGWMIYSQQFQKILTDTDNPGHTPIASNLEKTPKTIAVLPFENLSPDKDQEYFADGIAEELLNSLTRISELEVRGRTSSFYFKGKNEDLNTISKMLNVEYILEGSVRKADDQVRITVQLINTPRDAHVWSKTYEFKMDDIFAIQDDIAKSVADAMQITLGVGELGRAPGMTKNPAAYDAYLAGYSGNLLLQRGSFSQATEQLEKAVTLDPEFAICWSRLGDAYSVAASLWHPERAEEFIEKKKAAFSRVIELVPDTDLALNASASLSGDLVEIERLAKKTISLNPEDLETNAGYGDILLSVGRPTEAIDTIQRLVRKEPLSPGFHLLLGWNYEIMGKNDDAVIEIKKGKELTNQPELYNGSLLILAMEENNRVLIDRYMDLFVNPDDLNHALYSLIDTPEKAGTKLRLLLSDPAYKNFLNRGSIAVWASYFGEDELALQAYSELKVSDWTTFHSIWYPIHKKMRKLPGFKDLVRELGLVDYWRRSGNWGEFCHPVGNDDFECE